MPLSVDKEFVYKFSSKGVESTLRVPVPIPFRRSAIDLTGRLVFEHNLPCNIEVDLSKSLEKFIDEETSHLHDTNADEAIKKVKNEDIDIESLVSSWDKTFRQEVRDFAPPEEETAEQVFSDVYHTLIHSPALETLLNLEHTYAMTMEEQIYHRNKELREIDAKQQKEMQQAVENRHGNYTDEHINHLAQRHFDNLQLTSEKWACELNSQHEIQKQEFREWVMKVHEDRQGLTKTPQYMQRMRSLTSTLPEAGEEERTAQPRMEESFTIHLGAQMKTTHNLRLLCASVFDLCQHKPHTVGGMMMAQPQRLQTAMSLYSNTLCGLILLVDNRLNLYTGIKQELAKVCEKTTDFHFPNLEAQFNNIEQHSYKANEVRPKKKYAEDGDRISQKSYESSSSDSQEKGPKLVTGDFYITRHSNLSEVHTIFQMVTDDSVRADITSRHPIILSLRSVIKLCFKYDITTLTIPLLLTHEMSEEMTIPWCLKRAELVFKCVKGFMMEMATYGGLESRTIQFLVPLGISSEMFNNISNMLPTIFRLSNPVTYKSQASRSFSSS